jgi:hypothetical protein
VSGGGVIPVSKLQRGMRGEGGKAEPSTPAAPVTPATRCAVRRVQGGLLSARSSAARPAWRSSGDAGRSIEPSELTRPMRPASGRGDCHGRAQPWQLLRHRRPASSRCAVPDSRRWIATPKWRSQKAVAMGGMPFVVLAESFARQVTVATRALTVSFPGAESLPAGRAREPQDSR